MCVPFTTGTGNPQLNYRNNALGCRPGMPHTANFCTLSIFWACRMQVFIVLARQCQAAAAISTMLRWRLGFTMCSLLRACALACLLQEVEQCWLFMAMVL
jgi:hypothetical protein